MSKGLSGLFEGTKGTRQLELLMLNRAKSAEEKKTMGTKQAMLKSVNSWAQSQAKKLAAVSKSKRKDFNTACIVFDEAKGILLW